MSDTFDRLRSGALEGSTRISLRDNLNDFPREVFSLSPTLEILDLSNNQLSALPDDLDQLKELKILFLSNNNFVEVPRVLATCPKLEMIAFKSNQISSFPENALPLSTTWLMLTNNQISKLPASFGKLTKLRKLALAGNALSEIPESIQQCQDLELARFSANQLQSIPDELLKLPKLAWLGISGNNCTRTQEDVGSAMPRYNLSSFELKDKIGEGASGHIYLAEWASGVNSDSVLPQHVAVKLFKGHLTSDGFAKDEVNCTILAGYHPNLVNIIGHISEGQQLGLVMDLIPKEFTNLGQPPNFETCTRDTFPATFTVDDNQILSVARSMCGVLRQIHSNGVSHGDIYAHNISVNSHFKPIFGDFGAGTHIASLPVFQQLLIEKIEVRAFGCFLDDLLNVESASSKASPKSHGLRQLSTACMNETHNSRPTFAELTELLESL